MKKFLCAAMATVLAFSLAACSGGTPASTSGAAPQGSGGSAPSGTVTVFGWGSGSEMDSYKQIVKQFNEANKGGVQAKLEVIPSTDYTTKLNAMLAAGTAADVIMSSADFNGFYYRNGNFENLTPFVERDGIDLDSTLIPGAGESYLHGDYREGLPFVANTMVIAYNKDYFDAHGVAYPTGDWTWDEFVDTCAKLTTGSGDAKEYAMSYHWATTSLAHFAAGGQLFDLAADPAVMTADDPKTIEGIEMYADLIKNGYCTDTTASQNMPSEQRFFGGKCGMIFFFPWDIANFNESIGSNFAWDIVTLPKNAEGDPVTLLWGTGYAMNSASKNKDAAWEFIKYACLSEDSAKVLSANGMPVVKTVADEYGKGTIAGTTISLKPFVDALECAKPNLLGGAFNPLGDIYGKGWTDIVYNGADAAARMKQVQTEGQPILDELMQAKTAG